jgi:hypothetical protein
VARSVGVDSEDSEAGGLGGEELEVPFEPRFHVTFAFRRSKAKDQNLHHESNFYV